VGETEGNLHHIEEMRMTLTQLSRIRRTTGDSVSADGGKYSVVGFFGGPSGVLVDLGQTAGFGAYMLKPGADADVPGPIYFGYALLNAWRGSPGGQTFIAKCPFVIIKSDVSESLHLTPEKMEDKFGFLRTPCTEFKMPMSLNDVDHQ
jgi:hypothetical protein